MDLSKYFTVEEFKCPDCSICNVNPILLDRLDKLRLAFGKPINVSSGCRCYNHNKAVGGASDSLHITTINQQCGAADLRVLDGPDKYRMLELALSIPFLGIGLAKDFIHVDIRTQRTLWTYPVSAPKLEVINPT